MSTVAVIGGGLTGLTAAYRMKQQGLTVVVYEAAERAGGVIRTERREGYLADLGPNSFAQPGPQAAALITELGLDPERVTAAESAAKRYIVRRGRLLPLPRSPRELLTSRLLSNTAKVAVFGEALVEPSDSPVDESVAAFTRRRFNQEVLDYVVNPFVAGIYAGDPEQLSLRHAFPRIQALEANHGSLLKAFTQQARARRAEPEPAVPQGGLVSFREGMETLPAALARALGHAVRLRSRVTAVGREGNGWTVSAAFGEPASYDAVVFTGPAHAVDEIVFGVVGSERLPALASIAYPPVAVLVFGFRRDEVAHPLDGFGFLVPEVERRYVLGAIFSSTLFPGRAPDGHVALTCFIGGTRDPQYAELDEQTLTPRVLDDLHALLGARGAPSFRAYRLWPRAIPQYVLGYGRYRELIEELERRNSGLFFAGTYRDGIAVSDAITSGEQVANRVAESLAGVA